MIVAVMIMGLGLYRGVNKDIMNDSRGYDYGY